MLKCDIPILVEGKYDRIRLSSFIDGTILETHGFRIFKDKEMLEMLRALAKKTGLIVLTDSDAAGFQIRNYLRGAIPEGKITHVYVPDVYGKERRKILPSKEGKLGVEGLSPERLEECFKKAGVFTEKTEKPRTEITVADLFSAGLSGTDGALKKRRRILAALGFPEHLTTKAMIPVLNTLFSKEEWTEFLKKF